MEKPKLQKKRTTRKALWRELLWRKPIVFLAVLILFASTADWLWDELVAPRAHVERPKLLDLLLWVPWYWWTLAGLVFLVLLIGEHSYQLIHIAEEGLSLERDKHKTPDLHGDILVVFWDFVTINKTPDLSLLDIFVRLRLVNHEDIGTTTKESRLRIELNGEQYEAMGESPGLGKIVHDSSYRDEFTTGEADWGEEFGVVTSVTPFYPHIPLQISVEQKGWIKFRIHGEFKDPPPNCNVDVTIVDSLGGDHSIHRKHLPFSLGRFNA